MSDSDWLTIDETAQQLGLRPQTVCLYLHSGRLAGEKGQGTNGPAWTGVSRQSVEAYRRRQEEFIAARPAYLAAYRAGLPGRCPRCTILVEHPGELCDECQALVDLPYYHYRPLSPLQATTWDSPYIGRYRRENR